jgi:hypothetical protein
MAKNQNFGDKLIESLDQALAYERGELSLRTRIYQQIDGQRSI